MLNSFKPRQGNCDNVLYFTAIFYHIKIWHLPGMYFVEFLSCLKVCKERKISLAINEIHAAQLVISTMNLLGPFNIENKMIISKSWHSSNGSGCILPTVETDEGKSLQVKIIVSSWQMRNTHTILGSGRWYLTRCHMHSFLMEAKISILCESSTEVYNLHVEMSASKTLSLWSLTLDCPVFLSLARYILEMEPKGLKSSCKSVSRVSSDRLVTRMVALSSAVRCKHTRTPFIPSNAAAK